MSPQYFDDLLYKIMARVENGFGRLEEGQVQNRMAAEARAKDLHKRIDKVEDRIERMREDRHTALFSKVFGLLVSHWQQVLWLVLMGLVALGILKPDTVKGILASTK